MNLTQEEIIAILGQLQSGSSLGSPLNISSAILLESLAQDPSRSLSPVEKTDLIAKLKENGGTGDPQKLMAIALLQNSLYPSAGAVPIPYGAIAVLGQSNALGYGNAGLGLDLLDETPSPIDLMFNTGARFCEGGYQAFADPESLVPLEESLQTIFSNDYQATCLSRLCANFFPGRGIPLVGIIAAKSGAALSELVKGQDTYTRLTEALAFAASLSGVSAPLLGAVLWQGEADADTSSASTWKLLYQRLQRDLRLDFGSSAPLPVPLMAVSVCMISGVSDNEQGPATALYEMLRDGQDVAVICPGYCIQSIANNGHSGVSGHSEVGVRAGQKLEIYYRTGYFPKPLYPISFRYSAKEIFVEYAIPDGCTGVVVDKTNYWPAGALAVYPGAYTPAAHAGFKVLNDGTDDNVITAVDVLSTKLLRITCTDDLSAPVLRYAMDYERERHAEFFNIWSPGGNVFARSVRTGKINGIDTALHEWCIAFQQTLY